jgi:hypothetical protein
MILRHLTIFNNIFALLLIKQGKLLSKLVLGFDKSLPWLGIEFYAIKIPISFYLFIAILYDKMSSVFRALCRPQMTKRCVDLIVPFLRRCTFALKSLEALKSDKWHSNRFEIKPKPAVDFISVLHAIFCTNFSTKPKCS